MEEIIKYSNYNESALKKIEEWDADIMDKLLDEFEKKIYPLDDHDWESIYEIKKALWIGYNYKIR